MIITEQYLAGFFDGEGCVTYGYGRNKVPHLAISIANTERDLLEAIQEKYGGKIYEKGTYSDKHKTAYAYQTCKCRQLVEDILPHLIIKKRQAELMLEYLSTVDNTVTRNGLSEEVKTKRQKMVEELKTLNKRGN